MSNLNIQKFRKKIMNMVEKDKKFKTQLENKFGSGVTDIVKEGYDRINKFFQGARDHASPAVRNILKKYGNSKIIKLRVCRVPIHSLIDKALNLISLGKWNKNKKKYGYDELFHLYIVVEVENDDGSITHLIMEKNHVVNIAVGQKQGTCMYITMTKNIKLIDFLINGEKYQGKTFWFYNAFNNNCQVFVKNLLLSNGIATRRLLNFVFQTAENILDGYSRDIANGLTGLASRFDIILSGDGIHRNIYLGKLNKF